MAQIEITHHHLPLSGLPPELSGTRVAHLSDMHIGLYKRRHTVKCWVSMTNACEPDLVVITGDFVSFLGAPHLSNVLKELTLLKTCHGVFACVGNHDYWEGIERVTRAVRGAGVRLLVNENIEVMPGLWLAGVDDLMSGEPDWVKTTEGIPVDAAMILLSHNPTALPQMADRACLILAGHTHGGKTSLPGGAPRGMARWMQTLETISVRMHHGRVEAICGHIYPAGWYQQGRARMYVNRGIGCHPTGPFRAKRPPEIACIVVE